MYMPTGREAVMIDGQALTDLITALGFDPADSVAYRLRLSYEDGKAKWKINDGGWSPPYPQGPDPIRTH